MSIKYKDIERINSEVNANSIYKTDMEIYGIPENWTTGNLYKDCEDYALTKRKMLLELGMKPIDVCITLCWIESGEYHAVLYVQLPDGAYILDNRYDWPMKPSELPYKWDKMLSLNKWYEVKGF